MEALETAILAGLGIADPYRRAAPARDRPRRRGPSAGDERRATDRPERRPMRRRLQRCCSWLRSWRRGRGARRRVCASDRGADRGARGRAATSVDRRATSAACCVNILKLREPHRVRRHGAARRHRRRAERRRASHELVARDGRRGPFAPAGLSRDPRRRRRHGPHQGCAAGIAGRPRDRSSLSRILRQVLFVAPSMRGARPAAADAAARASTWRWWSTSSAASTGWSPSRTWSRRSSARSRTSTTSAETPQLIERGPTASLIADARTTIEEFEERVGPVLTTRSAKRTSTRWAGWSSSLAGRVPARGELIKHPSGIDVRGARRRSAPHQAASRCATFRARPAGGG